MKKFVRKYRGELIVAAVAVLVRLVYLLELSTLPDFAIIMVDEKWHWEWAQEIINHSFWGDGSYFRAPLYGYFLAALSWISGSSIFWSKVLQLLLCGFTASLIYRMTAHLFGHRAALIAGLAYAFYATLIFYETMFLIPALFLFFLCWGMYRVLNYRDSSSSRHWLITGIVFGLAVLARPNVLLVIPFLMLWLYFETAGPRLLARLRRPALLLAGVVLMITPVTVRNLVVTGDFILISSQGGVNLYIGNNSEADGLTMLMPEVDLDESVSWRQFRAVTRSAAESEVGRSLTDPEESSFWTGKAASFIVSHPDQFISLLWKKSVYLLSAYENSDNANTYYQRTKSHLLSLLLWKGPLYIPLGLLTPLFFAGLFYIRRDIRSLTPLLIMIGAYVPSIVLFLVTARHRLPLIPFMIIIAAGFVVRLTSDIASKNYSMRTIAISALVFVVCLGACNRVYYDLGQEGTFQIHFNNALRLEQIGDYVGAEKEYSLADAEFSNSVSLVNNLGFVQYKLGRLDAAASNFARAIRLDPDYPPVYNNLALLMQQAGQPDSAAALYHTALEKYSTDTIFSDARAQVEINLGRLYQEIGSIDSASASFRRAAEQSPSNGPVTYSAAAFFATQRDYITADSLYAIAQSLSDPSAKDIFNHGLSFLQRGAFFESIEIMREAAAKDAALYQAYYCIAAAQRELSAPTDTILKYLDLCLQITPSYPPAVSLQATLSGR